MSARETVEKTAQVCLPKEKKRRRCVSARGTVEKTVCLRSKQVLYILRMHDLKRLTYKIDLGFVVNYC